MNKCPKCNHSYIPVVYGYPSEDTLKKAKNGEIQLGGCIIDHEGTFFYCKFCREYPEDELRFCEQIKRFRLKALNRMFQFERFKHEPFKFIYWETRDLIIRIVFSPLLFILYVYDFFVGIIKKIIKK